MATSYFFAETVKKEMLAHERIENTYKSEKRNWFLVFFLYSGFFVCEAFVSFCIFLFFYFFILFFSFGLCFPFKIFVLF